MAFPIGSSFHNSQAPGTGDISGRVPSLQHLDLGMKRRSYPHENGTFDFVVVEIVVGVLGGHLIREKAHN